MFKEFKKFISRGNVLDMAVGVIIGAAFGKIISSLVDDIIMEVNPIDNEFVKDIVYGVVTKKDEIDEIANKYLNKWTIDRLGNTDQSILRMGIYELLYTDTPDIVAINEAVELAKSYSDDDVKNMINGVLDKLYHDKVDNNE